MKKGGCDMIRVKKGLLVSCCCLSLLFTTGCWDRVEIEDTGLVIGVALDYMDDERHTPQFTLQYVVPSVLAGEKGGGQELPFHNVSVQESSLFEGGRTHSTLTSRSPNYAHLKVLVISKKSAQSINLLQLLNFFFRDHEIRRTVHVLISEEDASEILDIKGGIEPISALTLYSISEHMETKTGKMPPVSTLGDLSEKMSSNSSVMIQKVKAIKGGVQVIGSAIIKGHTHKMIGELNDEETFGINLVTGEAKAGAITGNDDRTDQIITYEIDNLRSRIVPKVKGEDISFNVNIDTEGRLSEDWIESSDAFDEKFIQKAEEQIKKEIKRMIKSGLMKTQQDLRVDVAGFGDSLRIHHPKMWKKLKEDWEERFVDTAIDTKVNVHIRQFQTQGRKINKQE
jgi:spore germination protein